MPNYAAAIKLVFKNLIKILNGFGTDVGASNSR